MYKYPFTLTCSADVNGCVPVWVVVSLPSQKGSLSFSNMFKEFSMVNFLIFPVSYICDELFFIYISSFTTAEMQFNFKMFQAHYQCAMQAWKTIIKDTV